MTFSNLSLKSSSDDLVFKTPLTSHQTSENIPHPSAPVEFGEGQSTHGQARCEAQNGQNEPHTLRGLSSHQQEIEMYKAIHVCILYIYIYVVIYVDVKNYGCQWEWIKMAGHPILVELHASQHTTTWRILCGSNFG